MLPPGLWDGLAEPVASDGPIWVAVEDDYGRGAAVALCRRARRRPVRGRRLVVPGLGRRRRRRPTGSARPAWIRELLVGASLLDRVPPRHGCREPHPAGGRETRVGLALFRDLAAGGMLVHDETTQVDEAVAVAHVRESPTGLVLVNRGPSHLVRALVWAVNAAHKPAPVPAIY